jgi:hypothetical protein
MTNEDVDEAEELGLIDNLMDKGIMVSEGEADLVAAILAMIQRQTSRDDARMPLVEHLYGKLPLSALREIETFKGRINLIRQYPARRTGKFNLGEQVLSILETETKA